MNLQIVTGADERMFLHTLILLQSFANAGAADAIKVCDFGLTVGQQGFLKSRDMLLVAKVPLPTASKHPWYKKAALVDFIPDGADAVMWLDSDVMLTGPTVLSEVAGLIDEMRRADEIIAACRDELDLVSFCRAWGARGKNIAPFAQVLDDCGIALDHPYLNSGVFVTTSREWLAEWKSTALDVLEHFLFEQNAFNVVAWGAPARTRTLDRRRWNVHGSDLNRISVGGDLASLRCDDQKVMVVHATSPDAKHVQLIEGSGMIGNRRIPVRLRLFSDKYLQARQFALLDQFIKLHEAELMKHLFVGLA
jgi:hypothetical protein